jgi:hypothetical protein
VAGGKGTPAPNSVIHYDGKIFYWTRWGIEAVAGYSSRDISSQTVAPLWNQFDSNYFPRYVDRINMSQIGLVASGLSLTGGYERIYWAYPAATSAYNNRILCLDYGLWKNRGFQGDPPYTIFVGWDIACFARWEGEGDRGELFGGEAQAAIAPWTYRLDFGDSDGNGLAGANPTEIVIPTAHVSPGLVDGGRPDLLKSWKSVRTDIKAVSSAGASNTLTLKFDIDEGKGASYPLTVDTYNPAIDGSQVPRRDPRMLPRSAIGVHGGALLEMSDFFGIAYPPAWELYSIAYTVDDLPSRHRGERNT